MLHRTTYRVIYGDTDQMGVVYHANYLQFFERGRCELLNAVGFDYGALEREGTFFAVVDARVRYRVPARFNDLVVIETRIAQVGRVRADFHYRLLRSEGGGEAILAEGETTLACIDRQGRPQRIPAPLAALLAPRPAEG